MTSQRFDPTRVGLQVLDVATYALVLVGVVLAVVAPVGLVAGGLAGVKRALFLVGFAIVGYAVYRLRPTPRAKRRARERARQERRADRGTGDPGPGPGPGPGDGAGSGGSDGSGGTGADPTDAGAKSPLAGVLGVGGSGGPTGDGPRRSAAGTAEPRGLQRVVGESIPERYRLPAEDRLHPGGKLLVAGVAVLVLSYLMEAAFGVGVGG